MMAVEHERHWENINEDDRYSIHDEERELIVFPAICTTNQIKTFHDDLYSKRYQEYRELVHNISILFREIAKLLHLSQNVSQVSESDTVCYHDCGIGTDENVCDSLRLLQVILCNERHQQNDYARECSQRQGNEVEVLFELFSLKNCNLPKDCSYRDHELKHGRSDQPCDKKHSTGTKPPTEGVEVDGFFH